MTFETFKDSLKNTLPAETNSVYLKALWYDAKGDWSAAHHLVDSLEDVDACWVHAYLHRKEGDNSNANYWYRKAGKKMPVDTLDEEWENITRALL